MYPKSHKQFSNDEKEFIVDEAQKVTLSKRLMFNINSNKITIFPLIYC